MKKLRIILVCGSDLDNPSLGEVECVFDEDANLIGGWDCNDADWRDNYFNGFLEKCGITIERIWESRLTDEMMSQIINEFGNR